MPPAAPLKLMPEFLVAPGQIWQDDCYYLDRRSGECMRKYVLVLAIEAGGDPITAVFTSKPNGLTERPPCSLGAPREGYFIGIPGGAFGKPTWVDFSSVHTLDARDLALHVAQGRTKLLKQSLDAVALCAVLRCLLRSDDITNRQARWIGDTAASLQCA